MTARNGSAAWHRNQGSGSGTVTGGNGVLAGEYSYSTSGRRPYPLHKVVAAVAHAETGGVVAALGDASFAHDRIEVVTAADVAGLDEPVGGSSRYGYLTRLKLSLGADLDEIELGRRELANGQDLILVQVDGEAEEDRAHGVLRRHGGHAMSYFGRWIIRTPEGDAQ